MSAIAVWRPPRVLVVRVPPRVPPGQPRRTCPMIPSAGLSGHPAGRSSSLFTPARPIGDELRQNPSCRSVRRNGAIRRPGAARVPNGSQPQTVPGPVPGRGVAGSAVCERHRRASRATALFPGPGVPSLPPTSRAGCQGQEVMTIRAEAGPLLWPEVVGDRGRGRASVACAIVRPSDRPLRSHVYRNNRRRLGSISVFLFFSDQNRPPLRRHGGLGRTQPMINGATPVSSVSHADECTHPAYRGVVGGPGSWSSAWSRSPRSVPICSGLGVGGGARRPSSMPPVNRTEEEPSSFGAPRHAPRRPNMCRPERYDICGEVRDLLLVEEKRNRTVAS